MQRYSAVFVINYAGKDAAHVFRRRNRIWIILARWKHAGTANNLIGLRGKMRVSMIERKGNPVGVTAIVETLHFLLSMQSIPMRYLIIFKNSLEGGFMSNSLGSTDDFSIPWQFLLITRLELSRGFYPGYSTNFFHNGFHLLSIVRSIYSGWELM